MTANPLVLHNAITLDKAVALIEAGHIPCVGRLEDFSKDNQLVLSVRHTKTRELLYVVELTDGLPMKRFKVQELLQLFLELLPDSTSFTIPLVASHNFEFSPSP